MKEERSVAGALFGVRHMVALGGWGRKGSEVPGNRGAVTLWIEDPTPKLTTGTSL